MPHMVFNLESCHHYYNNGFHNIQLTNIVRNDSKSLSIHKPKKVAELKEETILHRIFIFNSKAF
ncbi:hypothetical protein HanIR_Chr02g0083931 [Helianthus annuus]|nr:hypothetical protein HanIR_Chr02g0083931 [Helianthus annuus]